MGFFNDQFSSVVEWEEYRDDVIFWKWPGSEIKRGSKLILRAGQDAVFMYNGVFEGIFTDEGTFDIESDIIPFLSTLKSFRFGFNTPLRAEVMFINTKEFTKKWGTKNPIALPVNGLPGGMPIRSFGMYSFKVADARTLIDKIAGIKQQFTTDDVAERVSSVLDPILMRAISTQGKDMFNLQANAPEIGNSVKEDLDMQLLKIGLTVTDFQIQSVSYPEKVAEMQEKAAAAAMVSDTDHYTRVQMADALGKGGSAAGSDAASFAGMAMGMAVGSQMAKQMTGQDAPQNAGGGSAGNASASDGGAYPKFCPNCGRPTDGSRFCPDCGQKLA
ncbi:MAG: SPFH domain-containing protein [Lachnospiraceae bacterium]|jgi:membrane protease subunit (stomatin/prohibitin family)